MYQSKQRSKPMYIRNPDRLNNRIEIINTNPNVSSKAITTIKELLKNDPDGETVDTYLLDSSASMGSSTDFYLFLMNPKDTTKPCPTGTKLLGLITKRSRIGSGCRWHKLQLQCCKSFEIRSTDYCEPSIWEKG